MLWEDAKGVLRCVTHGGGWGDPFGFAYFSTDGGYECIHEHHLAVHSYIH